MTLSGWSGAHLVPSVPPQDIDLESENNGRVNVAILKNGVCCLSHTSARASLSFSLAVMMSVLVSYIPKFTALCMADTYLVKWTGEGNMRREVSSAYCRLSVITYNAITSLIKKRGTIVLVRNHFAWVAWRRSAVRPRKWLDRPTRVRRAECYGFPALKLLPSHAPHPDQTRFPQLCSLLLCMHRKAHEFYKHRCMTIFHSYFYMNLYKSTRSGARMHVYFSWLLWRSD